MRRMPKRKLPRERGRLADTSLPPLTHAPDVGVGEVVIGVMGGRPKPQQAYVENGVEEQMKQW
jgi:hypothetical protein